MQLVDQTAMRSDGAFEAKTRMVALLDVVSAGGHITITRHGRPVTRLVPPAAESPASVIDTMGLPRFQGQVDRGHAMTTRLSIDELTHQDQASIHGAAEGGGC